MHLIRHHFRKWVLNYIKTLIFLTNEGSCLLFFHIEIVRDFFYAPPISSSIPCCNKKSWVQKITKSWVRIEIPIDEEETKQTISSFQRRENEDPENEDSIFESTVEINAKLKLKSSTGKSLSEALIFASTNLQYDDRFFIELPVQYMKITS